MTTILKATSKGQITLPIAWRSQFKTNQFLLDYKDNLLQLRPINLVSILKVEEDYNAKNKIKEENEKYTLTDLKKLQFASKDRNLSKKIDKIIY